MHKRTYWPFVNLSQLTTLVCTFNWNFCFFSSKYLPLTIYFSKFVISSISFSIGIYSLSFSSDIFNLFYCLNLANYNCCWLYSDFESVHFQIKRVPFYEIENILELSWLKKAVIIFLWNPEKVNGRKSFILWRLMNLIVKSSLHVIKNLLSLLQLIPVISELCKFPYFL